MIVLFLVLYWGDDWSGFYLVQTVDRLSTDPTRGFLPLPTSSAGPTGRAVGRLPRVDLGSCLIDLLDLLPGHVTSLDSSHNLTQCSVIIVLLYVRQKKRNIV